jgi:hypothetical protein
VSSERGTARYMGGHQREIRFEFRSRLVNFFGNIDESVGAASPWAWGNFLF